MNKALREHRRFQRFPLGLPVRLQVAGRPEAITVELLDLSAGGGRFRASDGEVVNLDDRAAFGFVIPGQRHCVASGRCVRIPGSGEFALFFDRANEAFRGFVANLCGQASPSNV